jgi:hypothetical protein
MMRCSDSTLKRARTSSSLSLSMIVVVVVFICYFVRFFLLDHILSQLITNVTYQDKTYRSDFANKATLFSRQV